MNDVKRSPISYLMSLLPGRPRQESLSRNAHKVEVPPEHSVMLAAKHLVHKCEGTTWEAQSVESQNHYLLLARQRLDSGSLLIKAKALAKIRATAWDDYTTIDEEVLAR